MRNEVIETTQFVLNADSVIIVDAGSVLVANPSVTDIPRIYAHLVRAGASRSKALHFVKVIFKSDMARRAKLGQVGQMDVWNYAAERLSRSRGSLTGESLKKVILANLTVDTTLIQALRTLQERTGCRLCLASDMARDGLDIFTAAGIPDDLFAPEDIVVSGDRGCLKRTPGFWEGEDGIFSQLRAWPWNCLLIDDKPQNCITAMRAGIGAVIEHTSSNGTLAQLADIPTIG